MSKIILGLTGGRYVGKSEAAKILTKYGFYKTHTFAAGLAMCRAFYHHVGFDETTAREMTYGTLKDVPCSDMYCKGLPHGVSSRFFMERLGKFMSSFAMENGHQMAEWTLGVEMSRLGNVPRVVFESVVYEIDYFRSRGGKLIRVHRDGERPSGEMTDSVQAQLKEDYRIDNNGTLADLEQSLIKIVQQIIPNETLTPHPIVE